ncbi:MAG: 30S ribosomal protein S2 [Candidatus Nealsonbacteria bacterium]|nr:30S ribosomal protein S2 [Candidatus Nealsonbacteria bacterium]
MAEIKKPASHAGEGKNKFNIDTEEMTRVGVHFGHRTSSINPKMNQYIFGVRNNVHIIDVEKTEGKLTEALDFIQKLISEGKVLLLIGTKIQIKALVKSMAQECSLPYVSERWLGGTFTNFSTIWKRIEYYKDLERKKESGELEKYTKKERAKMDEEIKKLEIKFGGIKEMNRVPDAIFVTDMRKNDLAVKEAKISGVKIIGICDTNVDPTLADYPIPASDDATSSVKYILDKVKDVILKAKLPLAEAPVKKSVEAQVKPQKDEHK